MDIKKFLVRIKSEIHKTEPDAEIILFGSYARGDMYKDSDIDLLILVNKEKISFTDEMKLTTPLYNLEIDTGNIISPLVFTKTTWETKHRITPFYENIRKEGVAI